MISHPHETPDRQKHPSLLFPLALNKDSPVSWSFGSYKTSQSSSFPGMLWDRATSGFPSGAEELQHFSALNRAGKIYNCFHSVWLENSKIQACCHRTEWVWQRALHQGLSNKSEGIPQLGFCLSFNIYMFFPFVCFFFLPLGGAGAMRWWLTCCSLGDSNLEGMVVTQCPCRAFLAQISLIMLYLISEENHEKQLPGSTAPFLVFLSCYSLGMWLTEKQKSCHFHSHDPKGCCMPVTPKCGKAQPLADKPVHIMFAAGI